METVTLIIKSRSLTSSKGIRVAFIVLAFISACNTYKKPLKKDSRFKSFENSTSYMRDKAFVEHTVRMFIDSGYLTYDYYSGFSKAVRDSVLKIHIDGIYYSSDSLKMISIIAIDMNDNYLKPDLKYKYYKNQPLPGHFFSEHPIIGVRDDSRKPWKIVIFKIPYAIGNENHKAARDEMFYLLFEDIKKWPFSCYDSQGKEHLSSFKYSIDQDEFWTGPLWQKGCYEEHAYYEVMDHRSPYDLGLAGKKKREIWPALKIVYPDSILNLF
jgi:hypothetical protein